MGHSAVTVAELAAIIAFETGIGEKGNSPMLITRLWWGSAARKSAIRSFL